MGLITGDFTVVWQPVPRSVPGREVLVYLCAATFVACGIGLLFRQIAAAAARMLLTSLLVWLLAIRAPGFLRAFTVDVYWPACRTAVLVAAAWVLYVRFATDWDRQRLHFATGERGLGIARALYGLALIPFGLTHFRFLDHTASMVPGWLPAHVAWAYFTGTAFVAAGIAILLGVYARLAVALSAWQMGLFLVLVWIPRIVAGSVNAFQRGEVITTWTLTAAAWVVADSYVGIPMIAGATSLRGRRGSPLWRR
jgi:uncharacterized membrane protein